MKHGILSRRAKSKQQAASSKQAMKQVLGIRDEKTRMKVTLPLALAPVTQEDDMRWNPNDDGIVSNP